MDYCIAETFPWKISALYIRLAHINRETFFFFFLFVCVCVCGSFDFALLEVCVFSNIVLVLPRGSSLKPVEQSVANLSPINLSVRPTRRRKANISTNANSFKVRSGYRNSEGKELNINDSNEAMENKDDQSTKTKPHEETGQGTSKNDIQNEAGKEKRSIKENIDEIEAALAQLKKELGL